MINECTIFSPTYLRHGSLFVVFGAGQVKRTVTPPARSSPSVCMSRGGAEVRECGGGLISRAGRWSRGAARQQIIGHIGDILPINDNAPNPKNRPIISAGRCIGRALVGAHSATSGDSET